MIPLNSDILPPIFDHVVLHFGDKMAGPETRLAIVQELLTGIMNAAAANARVNQKKDMWEETYPDLHTSDRLSGPYLSRAELVEKIQTIVPLNPPVLETALILIESQIDLRLKRGRVLELSGVSISLDSEEAGDIVSWCQSTLPPILEGVASDRSTFWLRWTRRQREAIRIFVEGLQLAATLREAVPYRIKVDKLRINKPVTRTERALIRVLHISDLHLVENIFERGRRLYWPFGVNSHEHAAAKGLGGTLHDLKPRFDMVLATGDVTTDGHPEAFKTALRYVQREHLTRPDSMRIDMFGLFARKGERLLLPGNHDRYAGKLIPGQSKSSLFEEILETRQQYPYVVGYRPPGQELDTNSLTLLFFVFDSNLPEYPDISDPKGRAKAIACGRIDREELGMAFDQAQRISEAKEVEDLDGRILKFTPEKTVRIAALHHHPFVSEEDERNAREIHVSLLHPKTVVERARKWFKSYLTRMEDADQFLRGCFRIGIQLVLFGHEHDQYHRIVQLKPKSGPRLVGHDISTPFGNMPPFIHGFCCPSAMVRKPRHGHGFYLLDFFHEKEVTIEFYSSKRDGKSRPGHFGRDDARREEIKLFKRDVSGSGIKILRDPDDGYIKWLSGPNDGDIEP